MLFRKLTPADAADFRAFRRAALVESPAAFGESVEEHDRASVEDVARRLAADPDSNFVLAAFDGGRIIGTAGFHREQRLRRRHKGVVWGVFVDPACRGRGIAGQLLGRLLDDVRSLAGMRTVLLSVSTGQGAARRLYTRAGFRTVGIEPLALQTEEGFSDEEHLVLVLADF